MLLDVILDIPGPTDSGANPGFAVLLSTVNQSLNFQVGPFKGQDLRLHSDLRADNIGRGSGMTVSDINISTVSGVTRLGSWARRSTRSATPVLNWARSNRLDTTINSLSVARKTCGPPNAAQRCGPGFRVSDFSEPILFQAGTSVLAQANSCRKPAVTLRAMMKAGSFYHRLTGSMAPGRGHATPPPPSRNRKRRNGMTASWDNKKVVIPGLNVAEHMRFRPTREKGTRIEFQKHNEPGDGRPRESPARYLPEVRAGRGTADAQGKSGVRPDVHYAIRRTTFLLPPSAGWGGASRPRGPVLHPVSVWGCP